MRGVLDREQIRRVVDVDRGGDGDDVEAGLLQPGLVEGEVHGRRADRLVADLPGRIDPALVLTDARLMMVKADHAQMLGKLDRQRHPDIAQSDDGEALLSAAQSFIQ